MAFFYQSLNYPQHFIHETDETSYSVRAIRAALELTFRVVRREGKKYPPWSYTCVKWGEIGRIYAGYLLQ